MTRVRNWNSKVRTCKNKHCKNNSYKGIYVYLYFFVCDIEAKANKKKEDCDGPLKLQIKIR